MTAAAIAAGVSASATRSTQAGRRAVRNIVVTAALFTIAPLVVESQGLPDHGH